MALTVKGTSPSDADTMAALKGVQKAADAKATAAFKALEKKKAQKVPLMQETNSYVYRGTLLDFQEFSSTINTIPEDFEQLDYGTFKKLSADNEKKTL